MRSFRPPRNASPPAALPALLRATHLLGLALGSAFGRLGESGATAARLFETAEEGALLLRMTRDRGPKGAGPSDPGKGSRRERRPRMTVRQFLIEGSVSPRPVTTLLPT
jgi:hypothetical protein